MAGVGKEGVLKMTPYQIAWLRKDMEKIIIPINPFVLLDTLGKKAMRRMEERRLGDNLGKKYRVNLRTTETDGRSI